ncbi:MAG: deoxyribose-phosphate aldolase [Firmicutes bacterium]|nr:deoxyribose-phosphate aldolase [Bacillota bacterium]
MEISEILSHCDHTLLSVTATKQDILSVVDDGIKYKTASVCIPASFVREAAAYSAGRVRICTVIGFPNGYSTTAAKVFETDDAVNNGADEIDMVINIGAVKSDDYGYVSDEIGQVRRACRGKILKVIIETCLLTEQEKIKLCETVSASGADYIKTSTGFAGGGATFDDIELFAKHVSGIKIKAAGGIKSLGDAERFLSLGADRLGTSSIVKAVKAAQKA